MPFFLSAAAGVGATFFLSICGAALAVILGRLRPSPAVGRIFSGFACGVITALMEGLPLEQAVERGCAIGAVQCTFAGDNEGLPTHEALAAFISSHKRVQL